MWSSQLARAFYELRFIATVAYNKTAQILSRALVSPPRTLSREPPGMTRFRARLPPRLRRAYSGRSFPDARPETKPCVRSPRSRSPGTWSSHVYDSRVETRRATTNVVTTFRVARENKSCEIVNSKTNRCPRRTRRHAQRESFPIHKLRRVGYFFDFSCLKTTGRVVFFRVLCFFFLLLKGLRRRNIFLMIENR